MSMVIPFAVIWSVGRRRVLVAALLCWTFVLSECSCKPILVASMLRSESMLVIPESEVETSSMSSANRRLVRGSPLCGCSCSPYCFLFQVGLSLRSKLSETALNKRAQWISLFDSSLYLEVSAEAIGFHCSSLVVVKLAQ